MKRKDLAQVFSKDEMYFKRQTAFEIPAMNLQAEKPTSVDFSNLQGFLMHVKGGKIQICDHCDKKMQFNCIFITSGNTKLIMH